MTDSITVVIQASAGPELKQNMARELLEKFCHGASEDDLRKALYLAVQANLVDEVKFLHDLNVPFEKKYNSIVDLLLLAVCSKNPEMVELLASYKEIDPTAAIEQAKLPGFKEFLAKLSIGNTPRTFIPSVNKPAKPTNS